ncbi:cinnamoyl-CoA reductase 1 isoform X2 [Helianthus annuus]|uniref:cinnamoyl-CoA reductase 1 isoform X2 n=1 Tax=Helianthus annuus TaxID=4232 RepID=UPI000B8FFFD1|nr:cinnamoyl-CoA reductase 1 isoform X2 [Helianthus annuus]
MSGEGKVVCVTGASGYIASWLVKLLLARGYTVHATVRSLDDPKKTEHLLALDGAKERLSLFEANLSVEGSFDSAVDGCVCVFHTASPVLLSVDDPQLWYHLSKIQAENAAVKFSRENGLDLVIINPGYVIGPLLQPSINLTSQGFWSFIETGKEVFPDGIYILVDVRDTAIAHILAFEKPEANGRYCMVGNVVRSVEIMMILDKLYPDLDYSLRYKDKCVEKLPYSISKAKAESLGVEFTPLVVSLKDSVDSLKEKKLLNL